MNYFYRLSLLFLSLLPLSGVYAEPGTFPPVTPEKKPVVNTQDKQTPHVSGYLGMGVDYLPPEVRAHMPDTLDAKQGLIVTRFAEDSPAADNGIKLYDVLIAYDNQPVSKPEALIRTIREDQPGRTVQLKLVRQGETLTVPVSIGKQVTSNTAPQAVPPGSSSPGIPLGASQPQRAPLFTMNPTEWASHGLPTMPRYRPYPTPPATASVQPQPVYPAPRPQLSYQNGRLSYMGPAYPMLKAIKKKKHAWGDERHIWPDFYTKMTNDMWDSMINAPYDMGRMPGGWRAPSLSSPDPVTIGDAVTNQIPPMVEEMGNMADFSD